MAPQHPGRPQIEPGSGPPGAPSAEGTVMLELAATPGWTRAEVLVAARRVPGFVPDEDFEPVPMGERSATSTVIVRGTMDDTDGAAGHPTVVGVWRDTPVAPFAPPPSGP